jgi:hypothetical protein
MIAQEETEQREVTERNWRLASRVASNHPCFPDKLFYADAEKIVFLLLSLSFIGLCVTQITQSVSHATHMKILLKIIFITCDDFLLLRFLSLSLSLSVSDKKFTYF